MLKKSIILMLSLFILQACASNNKTIKSDKKEQRGKETYKKYYEADTPLYSMENKMVTIGDLKGKYPRYSKMVNESIEVKKSIFFRKEILNYIKENNITDYQILLPVQRKEIDLSNLSQTKGNKEAKNTFVIFSDFECPYCSKYNSFENEVSKIKDIKIVYKHFPLGFHKKATGASIATICASNQGKFWEFHDKLFANQDKLSDSFYLDTAKELKIDQAKFMECLTSERAKEILNRDIAEANKVGVRGTPTYFLNGVIYKEARNIDAFNLSFNSYKKLDNEVKISDFNKKDTIILYIKDKAYTIEEFNILKPNLVKKFNNNLANEAYTLLKEITETDIVNIMFTKEAKLNKYKNPEEYINNLIKTKITEPTEKEVKVLYKAYKPRLRNASFEQVKKQLKEFLMKHKVEGLFKQKNLELIKKYNAKPLLLPPSFFINLEDTPILGKKNAENTIFVYSDFQCPYCSRIAPILEKISKEKNIKVAFKHFPLSFHKRALPTSIASYCAFKQGKFWEFHNKAFKNQYELREDNFIIWAKELKLNIEDFKKCAIDKKTIKRIKKDLSEGMSIGVQGTPAIYINGAIYEDDPSSIDKINEFIKKIK